MSMVAHQRPGIDARAGCDGDLPHARDEKSPILVIGNNAVTLYTTHHHMVQRTRRVQSCSSRHWLFVVILMVMDSSLPVAIAWLMKCKNIIALVYVVTSVPFLSVALQRYPFFVQSSARIRSMADTISSTSSGRTSENHTF